MCTHPQSHRGPAATSAALGLRFGLGLLALSLLMGGCAARSKSTLPAEDVFNSRDLTGWVTQLSQTAGTLHPRDPSLVFRVVQEDGEPAIRVSGEGLGGLRTLAEFENYHLEFQFKWGTRRFAPREQDPRDSGLLYHGTREHDPTTGWIESLELGLLEGGETGDFWSVPGAQGQRIVVDVRGEDIPVAQRRYGDQAIRFHPQGRQYTGISAGILNFPDREKPRGEWNTVELFCLGSTSLHVINGQVNLTLTNTRRRINGREEPVTRGHLQLQCEGAETFFRRIQVRPLTEIPPAYREAAGLTRQP